MNRVMILLRKINQFVRLIHARLIIRASNLFDKEYYLANNPDVALSKIDPLNHYIQFGGTEGSDPGPYFSSAWYLTSYEDVKNSGINPLVHYLRFGKKEKRGIKPAEGLDQLALIRSSGLFDEEFYLANNPDVAQAQIDPLVHYFYYDGFEGRDPNANFSIKDYLIINEESRNSGLNPLVHYLIYEKNKKRVLRSYILLRMLNFLRKKSGYDLGEVYDNITSFADFFMRLLYARLYQKESFSLPKQIKKQYTRVPLYFNLRRIIRKARLGKIPIRIVFVAQDTGTWKIMESLYEACKSDTLFKTFVVNTTFEWLNGPEESSEYFKKKNIDFLDAVHGSVQLDLLNPDIIVVASPYDELRPWQFRTANLLRYARIVYIPYGISHADIGQKYPKREFGNDPQKNAWRIFDRSLKTKNAFIKFARIPSRCFVALGTPLIDQYYSSSVSDVLPYKVQSASSKKFKIIYTPHHTIESWSTFLRYGKQIRQLVEENEDIFLFFRPHPGLVGKLEASNLMSSEEFRSFFSGNRCFLYEGDNYQGLFHWADLLISDASSFLGEFAPTKKPIIFLNREDVCGTLDDTIREEIYGSCYVANSEEQITNFVQQLMKGDDPLAGLREHYQEQINVGMFTGGAGKRIAEYIHDQLG
ncbi:MAG: hypothetical protein GX466_08570 [Candidatus Cloacimonetes bacterium]|nr:hypothetical protein [Candidatus Cloacimonadota bacterium]